MTIKQLGYVTDKQGIHVCGYKDSKIIIQTEIGIDTPLKTLKLYTNKKGQYFNLEGKRVYLKHTLKKTSKQRQTTSLTVKMKKKEKIL